MVGPQRHPISRSGTDPPDSNGGVSHLRRACGARSRRNCPGPTEIIDEDYLRYRVRTNEYLCERLDELKVPVVKPAGGQAVFVDARSWLPHIPPLAYPGQPLAIALYEFGGIRSCEIGTVMFGQSDGSEQAAPMDLIRLTIPRRVYTQSHADCHRGICGTQRGEGNAWVLPDH